jgi:cobyrinic acid a,c-diamide synthase
MTSKAFVIAGPSSGVGKTTMTLGLMAALNRRGLTVQPFKCGPDFIDPGHHRRVCQRASHNLDGWMLSAEVNRAIFLQHSASADVSVVEGVMGLFDGAGRSSSTGSTAAIAVLLNLPIVLVVDASHMAASAAALVHGFATFDSTVHLAGVIFNRVGSATHYGLLKDAVERAGSVPSLGYLPHDERLRIPERYLGLVTAGEEILSEQAIAYLVDLVEQHIDLERLLDVAAAITPHVDDRPAAPALASARIGVARDRAFCFYYEDNVDALKRAGADIVDFSPMHDADLPLGLDALYFGGGYPELWADTLSANHSMRAGVKRFIDAEQPVYAECGGLMYLAEFIQERDGRTWPMVGALPWTVVMTERLQRFGYVEVTFTRDCLLGPAGTTTRGHSFHWSRIQGSTAEMLRAYQLHYTLADMDEAEGFTAGSVLASYIHLHFLSTPTLASAFVRRAARHRETALPVDDAHW